MKIDRFTTVVLGLFTLVLFLNLVVSFFPAQPALAVRNSEDIGRYQIAAWAAQTGAAKHHSGYYVLDTVTGKVVAQKAEVHGPGE